MIASFLIGLAGSLHCIGMCGPLAAAMSGRRNILYNIGRIVTYGLLGLFVSFIGMGLDLAGVQQVVSIVIGIAMLLIAITKIHIGGPAFLTKFIMTIRKNFKLNPLFSGMVNGILPCGMTLVALGYCVTVDTPLEGFLAMIAFGLGTLPAMLGFQFISKSLIKKLPNVQTALMIVAGIILIGRGVTVVTHHQTQDKDIVICGPTSLHSNE